MGTNPIERQIIAYEKLSHSELTYSTIGYYFNSRIPMSEINWHKDQVSGQCLSNSVHWSKMNFFSHGLLDIKNIWELSRFYFAPELAYQYRFTNNPACFETLKILWENWVHSNPYGYGANWLCGQEVSLRLINIILSIELFGSFNADIFKREALVQHCQRIYQTTYYAKAQKNNHALSEAIGLYLGSLYLQENYGEHKTFKKYQKKGYNLLSWCFDNLILSDGTFSQYSVNYHRMALDLITILFMLCQSWSIKVPAGWIKKHDLLINWLRCFVEPANGMAANIGANDGAMLLNVGHADYQDVGYSITFAQSILTSLYEEESVPDIYYKFKVVNTEGFSENENKHSSRHFIKGGFVRMSSKYSWAIFRYPKFKFRPGQCDIMHFDLWVKGVNVLLDSGTYSYNTTDKFQNYFKSVTAHNTVQIDDLEQMRSASRFLYLDWPKAKGITCEAKENGNITAFSCAYKHYTGAMHHRKIELNENIWLITDTMTGLQNKAKLFWHMPFIDGKLFGQHYENELITLSIECDHTNIDVNLNECWISKYYQNKEKAYVITAICHDVQECTFITHVRIK